MFNTEYKYYISLSLYPSLSLYYIYICKYPSDSLSAHAYIDITNRGNS